MKMTKLFTVLLLAVAVLIACEQPSQTKSSHTVNGNAAINLDDMMAGNARFSVVRSIHPDESASRSHEVAIVQNPKAVVIACADSRVSPELVFDEGIGDLFVIRTAGNVISTVELGSVEYAVEHLGVPLVIVMGHERCGAIKALVENESPHGHVQCIIDSLKNEQEIQAIPADDVNRLEDCVIANIKHGVNTLRSQSTILAEKIHRRELQVVGARYDLDDRKVTLLKF